MAQVEPLPLVPPTVMTGQVEGETETIAHARHALEPEVDRARMHALEVGEPGGEIGLRRLATATVERATRDGTVSVGA